MQRSSFGWGFWLRGFSFLLLISLFAWHAHSQVNVLTHHNDNNRTGANPNERELNTSNVNARQFGKLFSRSVDGHIYAQPLYVSGVSVANQGVHNVVYVVTEHNSVYAFDADDPYAETPLWHVNLGPSVVIPTQEFGNRYGPYHDFNVELGITGTPVIDLSSNTLYVVAFTKESGIYCQRLHALDIRTGAEKFNGPVPIEGSVPGTGYDHVAGRITFNAMQHLQRPGLVLWNGVIYIAFASHADTDPYHGWVFAYDAKTLRRLGMFNTTPNGSEGGIWQANQAPPIDSEGNLYFMVGNGTFDADRGGPDFGDSFVKLRLSDSGLSVVDWFTPCNQCCLDRDDTDLGSAGPLLLPDTNLLIGGGKQGRFYLLDQDDMGHFNSQFTGCQTQDCQQCNDNQIVQRFGANGGIFGSPIYWDSPDGPLVFVWGSGNLLNAYRMVDGRFETTPFSQSDARFRLSFPGGILSLSADGGTPGTGIVWATTPTGNSNPITVKGILRAFDASDVSKQLWNSAQNEAFDSIGNFAKFAPPTIANGKVYVPSFSGELHVFGLLAENPPPMVNIVAPTTRTAFTAPADIVIQADAISRDDSITSVDFYADDTLVGRATTYPYSVTWNNVAVGHYVLTALATDRHGHARASNPVAIRVISGNIELGRVIGINFVGGNPNPDLRPSPMGSGERAGVVARTHWNNATSNTGWLFLLFDDTGLFTGASAAWSANNAWSTGIPDTPGNNRMMKGYLDTNNVSTTTVTVYNLPDSFTQNGYDVYVYFNGETGTAARTANFSIDTVAVSGTDAENFSGTFTQAIASSVGNYVVFPGLTDNRFTVAATPGPSSDGTTRAPINGIQIVAHAEP